MEMNNELYHYGILWQKWGVRRYQNPDGSLTELGRKRYKKTVFVSGSSKTQDPESGYYRKKLPKPVRKEIDEYAKGQSKFVVGDAPGIDRQVQDYLHKKGYSNVEVYGPGKQVRYTADEKWKTNPIDNPNAEVGSKEWLAAKDIVMSNVSDVGIAVVLDEGAKATRKNVERLVDSGKDVMMYELSKHNSRWDQKLDAKEEVKRERALREFSKKVEEKPYAKALADAYDKEQDHDSAAELGLAALRRMGMRDETMGKPTRGNKAWFWNEDQTIGLPVVATLIDKGVDPEEVGKLIDQAVETPYTYGGTPAENFVFDVHEGGAKQMYEFALACWREKQERNSK